MGARKAPFPGGSLELRACQGVQNHPLMRVEERPRKALLRDAAESKGGTPSPYPHVIVPLEPGPAVTNKVSSLSSGNSLFHEGYRHRNERG